MQWELIVSQGHLSQILDAKNAPTGHFRMNTILRNVRLAIGVPGDTMRWSSRVQGLPTQSVLVRPDTITTTIYRSV